MAGISVAAVGASVAVYFYSRRLSVCGFNGRGDGSAFRPNTGLFKGAHKAPNSWLEGLFFFAEALRYLHGETLGRWRTADLLIGLVYLSQRGYEDSPAADLANHGQVVGRDVNAGGRRKLVAELRGIERCMRYCRILRERQAAAQATVLQTMSIGPDDIYVQLAGTGLSSIQANTALNFIQVPLAGVLKPSYMIIRDMQQNSILLVIRGTHSLKDMFTSLTGASKPHHMVDGAGVVLGYSHFGMLAGARWLLHEAQEPLRRALENNPGLQLKIVGHSLGGGTAAMLTMMLRDAAPEFAAATCLAMACPACMTLELAQSCSGYVTTIINNTDVVPTISPGAADALREEVVRSAWYEAFRADMRSNIIVRAVESSLGGVGSATTWTTSRLATASQRIMSCYQRRSPAKRCSSEIEEIDERPFSSIAARPTVAQQIEVARVWAEDAGKMDETRQWALALSTVQPIAQMQSLSWSQRLAERVKQLSSSLYRRAGEALSRPSATSKLPSSGTAQPGTPQAPAAPEVAADYAESWKPVDAPPQVEEMREDRTRSMYGNMEQLPDLPTEEELEEGIRAVQAAVAAAEHEEALRHKSSLPVQEAHPRSGIFVGLAGQDTGFGVDGHDWDGSQRQMCEEQWKRMTYPAGRIMHLLPRRLATGESSSALQDAAMRDSTADGTTGKHVSAEQSRMRNRLKPQDQGGSSQQQAGAYEQQQQPVYTSMAGEDGSLVMLEPLFTDADEVLPPKQQEVFVLLDGIPQEAYGRVKLCNTMVADHFIPAYLASLGSVIESLEQEE